MEIINTLLGFLTFISQIFLFVGGVYFLVFRKKGENALISFFARNGILFAFLTAAAATLISLLYSEIAGFAPCNLCWWQRIFIYPNALLLGIAWWKKDSKIVEYALPIAIIGGLIALYHTYIGYGGTSFFPCSAAGEVSCAKRYVFELGYITIPLMSLTSFALITFFLWLKKSFMATTQE